MATLIFLAIGLALGLAVGRWWAVAAAVPLGVWVSATTDVEVNHWLLGFAYAAVTALAIAAGVAARKVSARVA
jgi:hypothetical protein